VENLVGYARVSTVDQESALQHDALSKVGCHEVFTDCVSGSKHECPELTKLLDYLRPGDVLVVWKLDRLGRSVQHLIEVVNTLATRNIGFRSLTEGFDTTTSGGKLIFHVIASIAQFERDIIRERTVAGLQAARARGRAGGRRPKLNDKQIAMIRPMNASREHTVSAIAETFKVTRPTIYRVRENA
jgi:DNA invertase Pin-like site-specific DNA recombinase